MIKRINLHLLISLLLFMSLIALAQADKTSPGKSNPMKKSDVIKALESNAISAKELAERINQRGVDFELDDKAEQELKNAGANKEILDAVRAGYQSAPKKKNLFGKVTDGVGKQRKPFQKRLPPRQPPFSFLLPASRSKLLNRRKNKRKKNRQQPRSPRQLMPPSLQPRRQTRRKVRRNQQRLLQIKRPQKLRRKQLLRAEMLQQIWRELTGRFCQ
jgi:hypothetical protein